MAPLTINQVTIDPEKPGTTNIPKDAQNTQFILLRCKHRLKPDELVQAKAQKVEIMRLVEELTYLCKYQPHDLTTLEKNLSFVEKALVYLNDFVIAPALKAVLDETEDPQNLLTFTFLLHQNTKETGLDLFQAIQKLTKDAQIVDSSAHQLRARVPRSFIPAVAKLDYVEVIEQTKTVELNTVKASQVLKAGEGLKPNKVYQGLGEIIAIADQGFDKGSAQDVHPAFKDRVLAVVDGGAKTAAQERANAADLKAAKLRKIANEAKGKADLNLKDEDAQKLAANAIANADVAESTAKHFKAQVDTALQDVRGHGTHVAGCALGDLAATGKDDYYVRQMQSPAPKAKLYFQAIAPGDNVIPDLDTLFIPPEDTDELKAQFRIHSNSWGARKVNSLQAQEPYTQAESFKVDAAMHANPELLIIWSVGNDGDKWQTFKGQPVYRQAGDLAAAKNALVVGATFNDRYMNAKDNDRCIDGQEVKPSTIKPPGVLIGTDVCADFSSKGPTTDMRIKPDVVAPGVAILSALSRDVKKNTPAYDGEEGPNGANPDKNFTFMNGTSHAAPLVAGCAAVLRQARKAKTGIPPSGALIKAVLINGAVDLVGSKYLCAPQEEGGKKTEITMPAAPNPIQGYGRVDLERSLRCIDPPAYGEGGAIDVAKIPTDNTPWQLAIAVPEKKRVLRVTLVYTDPPGNIVQDELYLKVEAQNAKKATVRMQGPDQPQSPAYEKKPLPVYSEINNVQKVTIKLAPLETNVVLHVLVATLAQDSLRSYSIAYFFNAT